MSYIVQRFVTSHTRFVDVSVLFHVFMEEGHSAVIKGVKTATFYGWKCKLFCYHKRRQNNLRAWWTLCIPSKKPLSSVCNTTSNTNNILILCTRLLVEIKHDTEEYSCILKWKRYDEDAEIVALQTNRQCMLLSYSVISLAKGRSLILEYVIEDMLPLSAGTSLAFKKSVSGISSAYKQMLIDEVSLLV